jgi:hypothetical protein
MVTAEMPVVPVIELSKTELYGQLYDGKDIDPAVS